MSFSGNLMTLYYDLYLNVIEYGVGENPSWLDKKFSEFLKQTNE